jgi:outer membrane protein assembly factor BamA
LCVCAISAPDAGAGEAPFRIVWSGVEGLPVSALEEAAGAAGAAALGPDEMEALAEAVVRLYRDEGYLDARATVARTGADGEAVDVHIEEGRLYVVGDVAIEGALALPPEELISACPGLSAGAAFRRIRLEESFEDMLRLYGRSGYAECRVVPKTFLYGDEGDVDITLEIVEGDRSVVERIEASGGKTRSATVARTAGVKPGDAFDPWAVEDLVGRLSSSGMFSSVDRPVVKRGSADSLVVIEVPVVEPPSSSVSGLLGYSGREGGAVGFVDLELGNIMGTGREGSFRWENGGGGLSSYSAGYVEPWLGGYAAALELAVDHVAQDSTYSTTGFSADLRVNPRGKLTFALGVGAEKTALAGEGEGNATRRSRTALRVGTTLDARDNALSPRHGIILAASGDWGSRVDGVPGGGVDRSSDVVRYDLSAGIHKRVYRSHGLFLGARWRGVHTEGSSTPWDQLLRFGGAASLRGYREDQFRAEETALLQLEHRVFLGNAGSRLFLFTDLGFTRGGGSPTGAQMGYGLGIRAAAAGGQVGVDFGLGSEDSWSEGKVHVRMKRLF